MTSLERNLRSVLEKAVVAARSKAEQAAVTALKTLAVDKSQPFASHTNEQRRLRNELRAKARQLGGGSQSAGFNLLVEEVAYQQWHLMLFARFLAENRLLIRPSSGVAVTLEECHELAPAEGLSSRWQLATRYAGHMLPGIFKAEDPSVRVPFTPEGRRALENILAGLPSVLFTSDDGLGWVYQFWQSKRKREVSASGRKIEKLGLAAYSQLFTEDYMVRFLLENTLGAWWAARHPDSALLRDFEYLRYRDDGSPAAGAFSSWPQRAAELTVLDPCCGSGHFLVAAFEMIRRMRMEEEGLDESDAAAAVLRDNLFGLEIDPRCVQIAAFALATAAWKVTGYRDLPVPQIACSGIAVSGQLERWSKLARDDANMRQTLERLYGIFVNAPHLGSLINPVDAPVQERMFTPDFERVAPLLEDALAREKADDPAASVFGSSALGVTRAADLLARRYTLVATNVPYLTRNKQGEVMKRFLDAQSPASKADIATAFIERTISFCDEGGTCALVTPQNWLFAGSYMAMRQNLLSMQTLRLVIKMGEHAFESRAAAGAFTALLIVDKLAPPPSSDFVGLDVSDRIEPEAKADRIWSGRLKVISQLSQLKGPDSRITFVDLTVSQPLERFADSYQGIKTGDDGRFKRLFWEVALPSTRWRYFQSTVNETKSFGGLEHVVDWSQKGQDLARLQGLRAWDKSGVAVSLMRELRSALYLEQPFDSNMAAVVPKDPTNLPAIWAFCSSPEFNPAVRSIDPQIKVPNATLLKVPFDLEHWQSVAENRWNGNLPEPHSDNPTQWLFRGDPAESTSPLNVAVARLLAYQWPEQYVDKLSRFAISDGILPLSSGSSKEPASEQLRRILSVAYGEQWSAEMLMHLLSQSGFADRGLEAWLRDGFFVEHCKLFDQHPFIWQVWDGQRDGFSALVNYHKLNLANLNKLIYTYLGEWIRIQRTAQESGDPGSDARLSAAIELQKKLEQIRDGEDPYDIYVRWKPLHEQAIGWNPDLDDGIRFNIRPFVTAGVLRRKVNLNWNKDRGRNTDGSERINDRHLTLEEKRVALKEVLA